MGPIALVHLLAPPAGAMQKRNGNYGAAILHGGGNYVRRRCWNTPEPHEDKRAGRL